MTVAQRDGRVDHNVREIRLSRKPSGERRHGDIFKWLPGTRQIFVIAIDQVQTSCGYAVPQMELVRERPTLKKLHEKFTPEDMLDHWQGSTATSIDGLPARWPTALPR